MSAALVNLFSLKQDEVSPKLNSFILVFDTEHDAMFVGLLSWTM